MTSTERPETARGLTFERYSPVGKVFVTINYWDGGPREVIIRVGKAGTLSRAWGDSLGRLCSVALQYGTPVEVVCKQLMKVRSQESRGRLDSLPEIVGTVLEEHQDG